MPPHYKAFSTEQNVPDHTARLHKYSDVGPSLYAEAAVKIVFSCESETLTWTSGGLHGLAAARRCDAC